jgi:hypothetical protein
LEADPDSFAGYVTGGAFYQGRPDYRFNSVAKTGNLQQEKSVISSVPRTGTSHPHRILLKYIGNAELRVLIQAATNKSEAFNGFSQWLAFGGDGTVSTNDRDEQRKIIKYNHLVANCLIFHNVFSISRVLQALQRENYPLEPWHIAALSPYLTWHINRFGRYDLDMEKHPPELLYHLWA